MMYKWIPICLVPVMLVLWSFPLFLNFLYLLLLGIFIVTAVFILTLWGHIALSSPHQTSLHLLDKVEKEVRQLEEILKVRIHIIFISSYFI